MKRRDKLKYLVSAFFMLLIIGTQAQQITGDVSSCVNSNPTYQAPAGMTNYVWSVVAQNQNDYTLGVNGNDGIDITWNNTGSYTVQVAYDDLSSVPQTLTLAVSVLDIPELTTTLPGTYTVKCDTLQLFTVTVTPNCKSTQDIGVIRIDVTSLVANATDLFKLEYHNQYLGANQWVEINFQDDTAWFDGGINAGQGGSLGFPMLNETVEFRVTSLSDTVVTDIINYNFVLLNAADFDDVWSDPISGSFDILGRQIELIDIGDTLISITEITCDWTTFQIGTRANCHVGELINVLITMDTTGLELEYYEFNTNPGWYPLPFTNGQHSFGATGFPAMDLLTSGSRFRIRSKGTAEIPNVNYSFVVVNASNAAEQWSAVMSGSFTVNAKPDFEFVSPVVSCGAFNLAELVLDNGDIDGLELKYYDGNNQEVTDSIATADGTYYVVGTNAANCANTSTVAITINDKPDFEFVSPAAVCEPLTINLAELALTQPNDTVGLELTYYDENDQEIVNLVVAQSGTYYIIGENTDGCKDTSTVFVTINAEPEFDFVSPVVSCGPYNLATLELTQGSDTTGLELTYYDENYLELSDLEVSTSGTYNIVGIIAGGCSDTSTVAITINEKPEFEFVSPDAVCEPLTINLAELALTQPNDTVGLELTYYDENDLEIVNLVVTQSGTYYIIGENAANCKDTSTVFVTINAIPEFEFVSPVVSCGPYNLAALELTQGSDTVGLELTYYDENYLELSDLEVSTSGTYNIVGIIAGGCSDTSTVVLTINEKPEFEFISPDAVCEPATINLAELELNGNATDTAGLTLTYYDENDQEILDMELKVAGTYSIMIIGENADGCKDTSTVTVTINEKPEFEFESIAVCLPASVDLAELVLSSGDTTGLELIYYDENDQEILNMELTAAGIYPVMIVGENAAGCTDTSSVVVTISAVPEFEFVSPVVSCGPYNLAALVLDDGDTAGLELKYYDENYLEILDLTITQSGTYNIVGIIAGGCSDTSTVVLTINTKPEFEFVSPAAVCEPLTINLAELALTQPNDTVGLELTYYDGNDLEIVNLVVAQSGTYYIIGENAAGCKDTSTVTVTINAIPEFDFVSPVISCGPYNLATLELTQGSDTTGLELKYYDENYLEILDLTITQSGTYNIVGIIAGGCSDTSTVVLTINTKPEFEFVSPDAVCEPATINLAELELNGNATDTAGLTLTYYDENDQEIVNLVVAQSGTYYIIGENTAGCTDTSSVIVTISAKPAFEFASPVVCAPATVDLAALELTDGDTLCLELKYYDENDQEVLDLTITQTGTYYIVGTIAGGCSDTSTVVVTINEKPAFEFVSPAAVCAPAAIDLAALELTLGSDTVGLELKYYDENDQELADLTITATGTYYIVGETTEGCKDTSTVTVTIHAKPAFEFVSPVIVCAPAIVNLEELELNNGDTVDLILTYFDKNYLAVLNMEIAASDTFHIVGTSASGCKDTSTVVVIVNEKPEFEFASPAAACGQYDLSELEVNSGDTVGLALTYYDENDVELTDLEITASGTFYIVGENATGCKDTSTVIVTIHAKPEFEFAPLSVCFPATANLEELVLEDGDTLGLELKYYDENDVELTDLEITASGTFYIVGENATGCKDTSTVIVTIHAKPEFEFAAPSAVCGQYDLSELEVNSGDTLGLTLKYYDDIYQELPNTVVSATGTYYVIGTNAGNCSDTSAVTVTIHTKPEFSFANPTAVCSPATVNLLELELNQGGDTIGLELTYYDDIYQELANTTVTLSGTYYIIGVSAENCSDTSAVVVIIHAKPEFTFASPAAVCGQYDLSELALTSGDTAGLELKYYNASDVELPNTTVAVSGTYYVVGTNAGNCTDTSTVTITINAKPEFEFESSVSVCDPATVDLSELELNNGDTIGLNFTYYDNNDLSVSEIVTVSGTYYIVGTNAAGCSDTSTVVVAINEKPEFDFESPEPVCGSFDLAELVLDNGDTVGLTLTYYDEDDLELSDLEVSISGTYYVIGETAAGCSNISTVYITVSEKPEFDFESPEATCGSFDLAELVLDNGDTTDLELKYYDENDQELSSTIVTVSGTYYVVGENEDGCHNLSTVYVTINEKPEFEFASPEEVCYPATIDLSELVLDNGDTIGLELKYYDEDYQELSNLIIAESGTYYIIGTDAGGCADTSTILVSILRPVVENILEDITLESGEATTAITFTGASAFEWEATGDAAAMGLPTGVQTGNFGAYTIQNTTSSNLTATVTVTPIIGTCEGESKSFEITVLPQVGLISLEGTNITLNVFPNPAKQGEIVHITLEDNSVNAQRISNVTIYNIEGKEVSNTYYSDTKVELNTMYLTSGTYLLKISTENGKIINKKIVVQ